MPVAPEIVFGERSTGAEVATHFAEEIQGKNIIITGASPNSIGGEVLRVLAPYANLIVITGRSAERLQTVKDSVLVETPKANIRYIVVDHSSLPTVRSAAQEILQLNEPFHVVFNNAAISQTPERSLTTDGFELSFGVDHLAHFLFTSIIIPTIVKAATAETPARIVNTSSRAHRHSAIRWDDPNFLIRPEEYTGMGSYAQAKTANILFTKGLAAKLAPQNVLSFALHPGTIMTNIMSPYVAQTLKDAGFIDDEGKPKDSELVTWKTTAQAASTYIVAGFDPAIAAQTGSYLVDAQINNDQARPHATRADDAERLWRLSEELMDIKFPLT